MARRAPPAASGFAPGVHGLEGGVGAGDRHALRLSAQEPGRSVMLALGQKGPGQRGTDTGPARPAGRFATVKGRSTFSRAVAPSRGWNDGMTKATRVRR